MKNEEKQKSKACADPDFSASHSGDEVPVMKKREDKAIRKDHKVDRHKLKWCNDCDYTVKESWAKHVKKHNNKDLKWTSPTPE